MFTPERSFRSEFIPARPFADPFRGLDLGRFVISELPKFLPSRIDGLVLFLLGGPKFMGDPLLLGSGRYSTLRQGEKQRVAHHVRQINLLITRVQGTNLFKGFTLFSDHRRRPEKKTVLPLDRLLIRLERAITSEFGRGTRPELDENPIPMVLELRFDVNLFKPFGI